MGLFTDASVGVGVRWLAWAAAVRPKPPPIFGGQLQLHKTISEETQEINLHFHGFW
jgi:hypothetical protein